jgi:ABC-type Na+ transport system ATPase subunit NatA
MDLSNYILQVQGLNAFYGNFQAVRDVSFTVLPGEIFGLLGPNGDVVALWNCKKRLLLLACSLLHGIQKQRRLCL